MCTGTCWVYKCSRCGGTILKDTSISGHTCNAARRNRNRGCCRTGVEYMFYDKDSDEMCGLCEITEELNMINAEFESDYESCASSISGEYESCFSGVVGGGKDDENDDDDDEGGVSLSENEDTNGDGGDPIKENEDAKISPQQCSENC
ncbi:hypothetical protein F5Y00DRAFT_274419 [Daldinia vernicosa]|uniref:uncharacterized protein n=1 Tax=Daldinia vernicosa TaxID=114800 RepID=UPI002008E8AD|nr:uncharacterized protein F5Y00DRAFT_274419 [Daldinia vernicosa]KAI0844199.1 hypothetical protein F5Y00DRAFT_274419 [Daldinia vernicosa]